MTNTGEAQVVESQDTIKKIDSLSTMPYCGVDTEENGTVEERATIESGKSWSPKHYELLHERIERLIDEKQPFFSLEFFPPRFVNGVPNFLERVERLSEGGSVFVDMTWHMGSDPANIDKVTSSSSIAASMLDYCGVDTMLHMTCVQYNKAETLKHLEQAKAMGLRSILALRGDLPPGTELEDTHQFRALDMIRWIREEYGSYFSIGCAGYPLGHPQAPSYKADLMYLKAKCDAGANFVITQLFFEAETFENFVRDCREIGITQPIIPGIMPIMGYDSIKRIAKLSQLEIPQHILDDLEPIKHDDDAVQKYGTDRCIEMCRRILDNGSAPSIHLYTMNREGSIREILKALGLWKLEGDRVFPWKNRSQHPIRCLESVRPIYWSFRPRSYITRTRDWDQFPNGRWGNSSSPAFGDVSSYYLSNLTTLRDGNERLAMLGETIDSIEDVKKVFINYITQAPNASGVKVTVLPWTEAETGVQPETSLITEQLVWCNQNGILTVNSQPSVNGAPSTDPLVGWGKPGGYCYQKAYLECFMTAELSDKLIQIIERDFPIRVNYHAIDKNSTFDKTNSEETTPIAVTWGVFPGSEIAQPTVVDPLSFRAWRDEAYQMWMAQWGDFYPKESKSYGVIKAIHDEFRLVTLVDNDFQKPSVLFDVLQKALDELRK